MKPHKLKISAVLFDLDGTLADTAHDLGLALNLLRQDEGLPPLPYEMIRPVASHGAQGLLQLGFNCAPTDVHYVNLRQRFLNLYEKNICQNTLLFNGINELLDELGQQQIKWGIITNKLTRYTTALVPHLPFFIPPLVIVSGDTTSTAKPDPQPMYYAASQLSVPTNECIYVGDAERDIIAGNRANMFTAIAAWGYLSESDSPENWHANAILQNPSELLGHIN